MQLPISSAKNLCRLIAFVLLLALAPALDAADKLIVLIVDGQNNHNQMSFYP